MKKLFFLLIFISFCLQAEARYSNPTLRVLLFKTSKSIVLYGNKLESESIRLRTRERKRLRVSHMDSQTIRVGNRINHNGSLIINGQGTIQVSRGNRASARRYDGTIEIRPSRRGFYVINHIRTENYLEGVLNAEISTQWHKEVVKAQSIIARTFALYKWEIRKRKPWHLTSGYGDQYYQGANIADASGRRAIYDTRGVVVTYQGKLAQTFYHSNCGGVTEDPWYLWKSSIPYLQIQQVPYGKDDPRYNWEITIPDWKIRKILKRVGFRTSRINKIRVSELTESKRAYRMVFEDQNNQFTLLATEFRKQAGYDKVQSLLFDVIRVPEGFRFKGKGNGHGVGLCQWAAKEMAERGLKYDQILRFFYKDTKLQTYPKRL